MKLDLLEHKKMQCEKQVTIVIISCESTNPYMLISLFNYFLSMACRVSLYQNIAEWNGLHHYLVSSGCS